MKSQTKKHSQDTSKLTTQATSPVFTQREPNMTQNTRGKRQ